MLDLYLIRHAESAMNNKGEFICGRAIETPLTKRGVEQATLLGLRLKDEVSFDEVYSSIAIRAIETARIAGEQMKFSVEDVTQFSELLEINQGDWEGQPRKRIYTQRKIAKINRDNWNFAPPKGESQRNVEERMLGWVKEFLLPRYEKGLTVGVFTHGMAIKCLFRGIMNSDPALTYKINLDNTAITRFKYSERGWHLISVNDDAHLLGKEKVGDLYS